MPKAYNGGKGFALTNFEVRRSENLRQQQIIELEKGNIYSKDVVEGLSELERSKLLSPSPGLVGKPTYSLKVFTPNL